MHGKAPTSVMATTLQIKPEIYPKVDDDATIVLSYSKADAILQPSWNWPFDRKDMEVYGRTGSVRTILKDKIELRRQGETQAHVETLPPLQAPFDDSLHYFAAVISGEVKDQGSLSALDTNIVVSEILDAARRSAQSGKAVTLPLK